MFTIALYSIASISNRLSRRKELSSQNFLYLNFAIPWVSGYLSEEQSIFSKDLKSFGNIVLQVLCS